MPGAYEILLRQFVKVERFRVHAWHSVFWTGKEYEERHNYVPSHLTFMHFLAFDRTEHKRPLFFDPAQTVKAYCHRDAIPPEFWSEGTDIDVHEGDALVFPSYLEHRVPSGDYTKPLVTVSMNVTLPDEV
jgi:hypothetical protein